LFYCISRSGEATVRNTIFSSVCRKVLSVLARPGNEEAGVSLTFFTHSAGSVVAYDLLYHLFGPKSRRRKIDKVRGVTELRALARRYGRSGARLRVRKFFTMGSPFTPLACCAAGAPELLAARSSDGSVARADKARIFNPADIGLAASSEEGLGNPRWINFYDKDDIFAFPLEFLFSNEGGGGVVVDSYVRLGSWFPDVHNNYWSSPQVASKIVEALLN